MIETPAPSAPSGLVAASLPIAVAIGVFGVVYGAAARPVLGPGLTVVSSVIVFSGAAQFTMVGLLAAGAMPAVVFAGVATLALRHLPLGAVLQPRLRGDRRLRALVSWFLIDETTGLSLARPERVERTLVVGGGLAYLAWVLGTVGGVAGASLAAAEPLADALFPVLFVGLAALTTVTRADVGRTILAGGASLAALLAWPAAGVVGVIVVAVVAAMVAQP